MIQAASLNLSGGHSQFISNVHLESWTDEADFYERLYPRYIAGLLGAAQEFCKKTSVGNEDASDKTIVIISAGEIFSCFLSKVYQLIRIIYFY